MVPAMNWPLDPDVLMWIQIATGFFGGLTLIYFVRALGRKLGRVMETRVLFSPRGGCQDAMVQELAKARREILVQAYSFTADPLTFALVDAKKRGVKVEILLDRSNEVEKYSDLHILLDQGLDPMIDAEHAIAHNKIMIIDQSVVITGSYNFTNQAEGENAENVLIIKGNAEIVHRYRENFVQHKSHCKPAQLREPEKGRRAA
jgi:phosphatidylserine/phosphatidylglycerophosphate/cardiolipin synthase-like enzyme